MLSWEENEWNFQALKILSRFNLLPIQIDQETGRIQTHPNKYGVKLLTWRFFNCIGIFHWLFLFGRLVQSILFLQKGGNGHSDFRWDHFVLHFLLCAGYMCIRTISYFLFVEDPTQVVIIFNHIFQRKSFQENGNGDQNPNHAEYQNKGAEEMQDENEHAGEQHPSTLALSLSSALTQDGGNHQEKMTAISLALEEHKERAETLKEKEETSTSKNRIKRQQQENPRPIFTWPFLYSLQELMARTFFLLVGSLGIFLVLVLGTDPTRPQLLFTLLPNSGKNWIVYTVLLIFEGFIFALNASCTCFCFLVQLEFLDKCEHELKQLEDCLRNELVSSEAPKSSPNPNRNRNCSTIKTLKCSNQNPIPIQNQNQNQSLWQILKEMKELELLIELFNRCIPPCIFSFKVASLSVVIFGSFFATRHFDDYPLLSALCGYCAILCSAAYAITYEKAFTLPRNMDRSKNLALFAFRTQSKSKFNSIDLLFWPEFKREVKRIQNVGIKVGSFHQMERMSTLNYIDFVLRNVVNLLVLFPR